MNELNSRDEWLRHRLAAAFQDVDQNEDAAPVWPVETEAEIDAQLSVIEPGELAEETIARILNKVRTQRGQTAAPVTEMTRSVMSDATAKSRDGIATYGVSRRARSAIVVVVLACLLLTIAFVVERSPQSDARSQTGSAVTKATESNLAWHDETPLTAQTVAENNATQAEKAVIGTVWQTAPREKRRVTLPDGSRLYLNEQTTVRLLANRRVRLEQGEVFAEVAPLSPMRERFVVETPQREVTALGTKFTVKAQQKSTGVVVTQGQVKVSGVEQLVPAGQELLADGSSQPARLFTARRAAYVVEWAKDLLQNGQPALIPVSEHAGGSVTVIDAQGQSMKLSLRKFHVDVHVEDGFARTTIDQTYFNHTWQQLEGTFRFPLPADASLSRLAMYVNGKLMEGGMVERNHGRNVFEEIRHTRRDPALLEWIDGTTFQMRVFPLEARQEKRIVLSYSQRLPRHYTRLSYRFPGGHNLEAVRHWSAEVRVKHGANLKWECPSHDLRPELAQGDLLLKAKGEQVVLDRDLVVHLEETAARRTPSWNSYTQDGAHYVMLRWTPETEVLGPAPRRRPRGENSAEPIEKPRNIPARHWVLLVENSADRTEVLAQTQRQIARTWLENVEHSDTFSIVRAGTRAELFRQRPVECSLENIAAGLKFLEETPPLGALDLEAGLKRAVAAAKAGKRESWVVQIGTGIPVLGERDINRLQTLVPDTVKYLGIAVGKRWSKSFMQGVARSNAGLVAQINPDEAVTWRTFDLLSTLNAPRLSELSVRAADSGETNFLLCEDALAHGQELAAVVRLNATDKLPREVLISGKLNGRRFEQKLAVGEVTTDASYLPRTWARLEIDRLVGLGAQQHQATITELSKAMYVMSPFTSLLVLETEAMYEQYKVDRGRKDHWAMYPAPAEIPVVAEHGPAPAEKPKSSRQAEIWKSIIFRLPPYAMSSVRSRWDSSPITRWGRMPVEGLMTWDVDFDTDGEYEGRPIEADDFISLPLSSSGKFIPMFSLTLQDKYWYRNGDVDLGLPPSRGLQLPGRFGFLGRSSQEEIVRGRRHKGLPQLQTSDSTRLDHWAFGTSRGGDVTEDNVKGYWYLPALGEPPLALRGNSLAYVTNDTVEFERSEFFNDAWITVPSVSFSLGGDVALEVPRFIVPLGIVDGEFGNVNINGNLTAREFKRRMIPRFDAGDGLKAWNTFYDEFDGYSVWNPLLVGRPGVLTTLPQYAPGLRSWLIDGLAVLEREGGAEFAPQRGSVDPEARRLIESARQRGWERVRLSDVRRPQRRVIEITLNGRGQYVLDRQTIDGLTEHVVCDGSTLWHLYPEIALGAKRQVSRFHDAALRAIAPWYLPTADDLAVEADVTRITERTIRIVPLKDPTLIWEITFAADDRVAEIRVLKKPATKPAAQADNSPELLFRQTFAPTGEIKIFKASGECVAEWKADYTSVPAPSLKPETSEVVVLSLPYRTVEKCPVTVPVNLQTNAPDFAKVSAEDASHLLATYFATGRVSEMQQLQRERFYGQQQGHIGLAVLLSAMTFNDDSVTQGGSKFPEQSLGHFLEHFSRWWQLGNLQADFEWKPTNNAFIEKLKARHNSYVRWASQRASHNAHAKERTDTATGQKVSQTVYEPRSADELILQLQAISETLNQTDSLAVRRLLVETVQAALRQGCLTERVVIEQWLKLLSEERQRSAQDPVIEPLYCQMLLMAERDADAVSVLREHLRLSLERRAVTKATLDLRFAFGARPDRGTAWDRVVHELTKPLMQPHPEVTWALASQVHSVGGTEIAQTLFAETLATQLGANWHQHLLRSAVTGDGAAKSDRRPKAADDSEAAALTSQKLAALIKSQPEALRAAIKFAVETSRWADAEALLHGALMTREGREQADFWRHGALVAEELKRLDVAVERDIEALQREVANLPKAVDVQPIRERFQHVLQLMQRRAAELRPDQPQVRKEFAQRVVQVSRLWRGLDPDAFEPSFTAARLCDSLGQQAVAWDLWTTPLAEAPDNAAGWKRFADEMSEHRRSGKAEAAYATAFECEPTNAEYLFQHAQFLLKSEQTQRGIEQLRRLVKSPWQPRFEPIRKNAEAELRRLQAE